MAKKLAFLFNSYIMQPNVLLKIEKEFSLHRKIAWRTELLISLRQKSCGMPEMRFEFFLALILSFISCSVCLGMNNNDGKKNNWASNSFPHAYLKYYLISLFYVCTTYSSSTRKQHLSQNTMSIIRCRCTFWYRAEEGPSTWWITCGIKR